jgi:hypothetical protein
MVFSRIRNSINFRGVEFIDENGGGRRGPFEEAQLEGPKEDHVDQTATSIATPNAERLIPMSVEGRGRVERLFRTSTK